MKRLKSLITIIFFPIYLFAQFPADDCHTSTEGNDFWFGFMEGRDLRNIHFLEIIVTARQTTTFTITYGPDETQLGEPHQVLQGTPTKVKIPWELLEHFSSEEIENKAIHLTSVLPVNVFALNWDQNSNDVATIYPTKSLGTEYYAMCYTPSKDPGDNGKNTEFLIVATEDDTKIEITPSVNTHENKTLKGVKYEITLNRGQSYQVQSLNNNNWSGQGDLTGSYVRSDKPVAFFSGSLIAMVPVASKEKGTGDHLFEQIPPVHAWGREFFMVPYKMRYWDRLRILAQEDHTIVWINGLKPDTLDRGEYKDTVLLHYQPRRIISEKPVLIAQYSQSRIEDQGPFAGGNNEPFMTIMSPVVQFRNSTNFVVYPNKEYANYFVNAIFHDSQIPNMYLDGQKIEDNFDIHQHANNYSFVQMKLDTGVHEMWNIEPEKGFFAYSYSYGLQESFGYGVAFNLDNLLDLGSSINFQQDTLLLCYGDTMTLDAGWWFKEFSWNTGDTTQIIKITDRGWYSVEVKDDKGCPQEDSVFVYLSHPITDLGIDYDEGCQPYELQLDAGEGFRKYYWSTGERSQNITVDTTGIYSVTVQNRYGCQASDTMSLTVFPTPVINLLSDYTICDTLETEIKIRLSYFNSQPWDLPLEINWSSEDQNVILSDTTQTSISVSAPDYGNYKIYYNAVTENGCDTTRAFVIRFSQTPSSEFEILSQTSECSEFSREVKYTGEALSNELNFDWDFGSSQIVETLGWQHYRVSLALEEDPYISLVVEKNGCYSTPDSLPFIVLNIANPTVDQDVGCDVMFAKFSSNSTSSNIDYYWDFGNNTPSTESDPPPVFYDTPDFYDVRFNITSQLNSNCKAEYLIEDMVKLYPKPVAAFTGQQNECYEDTLLVKYIHAIDTTQYIWSINDELVYTGPDMEEFPVPLDEPYTYVKLKVNEYGCISDDYNKRFMRRPIADFEVDKTEGCLPLDVKGTGISTDEDLYYYWFKNRNTVGMGETYNYLLDEAGSYGIGIRVRSIETGCEDTILRNNVVDVYPNPKAKFKADPLVAYNENSIITFTNQSENGTDYFWDFGNGDSSEEVNPEYVYSEIGIYYPQLITSNIFECTDTASTEIQILPVGIYAPNAFRPDSEIEENRFFMPAGNGINPEKFIMKIYDRWGQLMFEANHMSEKWDGKTQNGKPAQMGNYIWIASYSDILGNKHDMKGQVLLIR